MRRAAPAYLQGIDQEFTDRLTAAELDVIRAACERLIPPER
jgi:hypothetical protein